MKGAYKTKAREEMSFMGMICGYPKAYEIENKEWIEITGVIRTIFDSY